MTLEYAPNGLLGVITPQANTTVEPELALMMPAGYAWINARLTSGRGSIEERLAEYLENFEAALTQFANAPVSAIAIACSGPSYFMGPDREDEMLARLTAKAGIPVFTATRSVVDALDLIGAKRVALVSPYPAGLQEASNRYWSGRGYDIVKSCSAYRDTTAFHAIYSLTGRAAQDELDTVRGFGADAIVMLGTGMPTIGPIIDTRSIDGAPVLSCMYCLAWRAIAHMDGLSMDKKRLADIAASPEVVGRFSAIRLAKTTESGKGARR